MDDQNQDELPGYYVGIDFRVVVPNLEQKQWLVSRIIYGVEKAGSIARRYHFKRKVLNLIAKRYRQGIPVHLRAGRPRILDAQSYDSIASNIVDLTCTSVDDLRADIKTEYRASLERRYPNLFADIAGEENALKISRRSLKRYVSRLHPGVFPAGFDLELFPAQ
jgi:hypothetical protein